VPSAASDALQRLSAAPVTAAGGGINYARYDRTVEEVLGSLNAFWTRTFRQELNQRFVGPREFIAYDPARDDPGCGGQPAGAQNAIYCADGRFIAWDEPTLLVPFYRDKGELAVGFVLAHEYGHAVQHSLGIFHKFKHTIEQELQADCFAGAWAGDLADQGILDPNDAPGKGGDLDDALDAIYAVGDDPSVPWQAPDAHGTGDQRATAFGDGYEDGVETCADDYGPGFSTR
jgi:uncharacterized protein